MIREKKLERDIEAEEGGAGVYNFNMKSESILGIIAVCAANTHAENYLW